MRIVLLASRVALALILLIEAYYKFIDMPGFVGQVQGFGLMPNWLATPYAYLLGPVEVLVAILLLINWQTKIAGIVSGLMMFSILFAFQFFNIKTGLYTDFLTGLRGVLQDQHLWMLLVSATLAFVPRSSQSS